MTYTIKKNRFLFLSILLTINSYAQSTGKIMEQQNVTSNILGKNVKYSIYLPSNYESSKENYPVIYLLHGYGGNNNAWIKSGNINEYTDKAIANNIIPPVIIVMPNADSSWYINSYNNKVKYEDFFINEFMPSIEKTYRTKAEKKYRAIAGLSMGGYGALLYALKHPNLFNAVAPLSAAIVNDSDFENMPTDQWNQLFSKPYGSNINNKDRLNTTWYANSILKLVADEKVGDLKGVHYWIDCGDDDFLTKGNCLLHLALTDKKIPHEFRVRDGGHNWNYWKTGIMDALQFITAGFKN